MGRFGDITLVAFDIDGTLTDGTTTWLGPDIGFTQTYSTRDGEAILRLLRAGVVVVPLSRNKTASARARMDGLGLDTEFLGVADKAASVAALAQKYEVDLDRVAFVGDGPEDALVFARVGIGCAVADAHPIALRAAAHVTSARGGHRAFEELADRILDARGRAS